MITLMLLLVLTLIPVIVIISLSSSIVPGHGQDGLSCNRYWLLAVLSMMALGSEEASYGICYFVCTSSVEM